MFSVSALTVDSAVPVSRRRVWVLVREGFVCSRGGVCMQGREQSTLAGHAPVVEESGSCAPSSSQLKDMESLPGPHGLPLLGVGHKLAKTPIHLLIHEERKRFGDLFRVNLGFGNQAVVVSSPQTIECVYRSEGKCPSRGNTLGLLSEASNQFGESPILAGTEGEEWKQLRGSLSKPLAPRKLTLFIDDLSSVAEEFISVVQSSSSSDEEGFLRDVLPFLQRWAMEGMSRFLFPQRIPFQNMSSKMADQLTDGIIRQNSFTGKTLFYPQWILKFYKPKAYLELCDAVRDVYVSGAHFINDTFDSLSTDEESKSFLAQWKADKKLTQGEILTNAANVFAGGMDTTANTLSFLLHLVSTHPSVQERLHEEVVRTVGTSGTVTAAALQNMHYVKGCVKEAMRLYPVAPVNIRKIDKDITLYNYKIPANTTYMIPTWSIGRDANYFDDPMSFKPERWDKDKREHSPFLLQPFGYGPRQCFGRRLAELQIWILLAKMMQNHTVATDNWSELDTSDLILRPSRPINIKLEKRQ